MFMGLDRAVIPIKKKKPYVRPITVRGEKWIAGQASLNKYDRIFSNMKLPSKTKTKKQFGDWLKKNDKKMYNTVLNKVQCDCPVNGLYGLHGQDDIEKEAEKPGFWSDVWGSVKGGISDVLKTGLKLKQDRDLYKLQMRRAEQGLPPLKMDELGPTIKTQIEIGPKTRADMFSEIGKGINKYLIPLVGAGALYMFTRKK